LEIDFEDCGQNHTQRALPLSDHPDGCRSPFLKTVTNALFRFERRNGANVRRDFLYARSLGPMMND
jgi:hypothetical protein